jgi:hypothetical protein
MLSSIQLSPVNRPKSRQAKPWMDDLLNAKLDKENLGQFMLNLIMETYRYSKLRGIDLHEAFIDLYIPKMDDEHRAFHPSDELLYRLKYLDTVYDQKPAYTRALYSATLRFRAISMMRKSVYAKSVAVKHNVELTVEAIDNTEALKDIYCAYVLRIDSEFIKLYERHKNNPAYVCNISDTIKIIYDDFVEYKNNIYVPIYSFVKLGEFLQQAFPDSALKDLYKRIKVFSAELDITLITDYSAFVLTERAYKKIFRTVEKVDSDDYQTLELGINAFVSILNIAPQHETTMAKEGVVKTTGMAARFLYFDVIPNTPFRQKIEGCIKEIEEYGNQKSVSYFGHPKSEVALDLAKKLKKLSHDYFIYPNKEEERRAAFCSDSRDAILEANAILAQHSSPLWQRIMRKTLLVIISIMTAGVALAMKGYYSKSTTGRVTFFNDITVGASITERAIAVLDNAAPRARL